MFFYQVEIMTNINLFITFVNMKDRGKRIMFTTKLWLHHQLCFTERVLLGKTNTNEI